MDAISQADEVFLKEPHKNAANGSDNLGVLGVACTAATPPLHPEGQQAGECPSGSVTATNVLRLLEYQDFQCALTGRRLTPDIASLDHVVPIRDGGEHVIENAQILHRDVNRAKSTLSNKQFIQMCREVVRHAAAKPSLAGHA